MKFLLPASVAESIFFATGLANKIFIFLGFPFFYTYQQTFINFNVLLFLYIIFFGQKHQTSHKFNFLENKERNVIFMNFG